MLGAQESSKSVANLEFAFDVCHFPDFDIFYFMGQTASSCLVRNMNNL